MPTLAGLELGFRIIRIIEDKKKKTVLVFLKTFLSETNHLLVLATTLVKECTRLRKGVHTVVLSLPGLGFFEFERTGGVIMTRGL